MPDESVAPITRDRAQDLGQDPVHDWADRCLSEILALTGAAADAESAARERRSSPRYPATGAALIHPAFGASVPCTLVDRSDGGARLRVFSVLGIPDEFVLSIGPDRMRARVAWRSPNELGVALSPA